MSKRLNHTYIRDIILKKKEKYIIVHTFISPRIICTKMHIGCRANKNTFAGMMTPAGGSGMCL
jgi:hypothetical protein